MTLYTVYLPPGQPAAAAAEKAVFVKDGFSWFALLLPVVFILFHRMWWVLLGFLVAVGAIELATRSAGPAVGTVLSMVFALAFATEANGLRRWTLARRGYRHAGVAGGRTLEEAERRFFDALTRGEPPAGPAAPRTAVPSARPAPGGIIGMPGFPVPRPTR